MQEIDILSEKIFGIGFKCTECGNCCRSTKDAPFSLMLYPEEIRRIMVHTGLRWEEIAHPFPQSLEGPSGSTIAFEWGMNAPRGECRFLLEERCSIYPARPHICRTYPFMLDGSRLHVSECGGLGRKITMEHARRIARSLIVRRTCEETEEERVREIFRKCRIRRNTRVLIDGDGMKVLDG